MRTQCANEEKKTSQALSFFHCLHLSLSFGQPTNATQIITESGAWCASSSKPQRPIVSYQRTATAYNIAQYSPIQRTLHAIIILSNYKRLLILIILLISFFLFGFGVFTIHVRNGHYFIASFSGFHRFCISFFFRCYHARLATFDLTSKSFLFLFLLLPSTSSCDIFGSFYSLWFFSGKISVSTKRYINSATKVP